MMLPLRIELAMTFTRGSSTMARWVERRRVLEPWSIESSALDSTLALTRRAPYPFRGQRPDRKRIVDSPRAASIGARLAALAEGPPRRPTASAARAGASRELVAPPIRGGGLHRDRTGDVAGLARQRDPSARFCPGDDRPGRRRSRSLSPYVAGIRDEEVAGGGGGPHFRDVPAVPQSRARRAAFAGVHDGGVVPRRRALGDADARLRRNARSRGGGRGDAHAPIPRPQGRSFRAARAADGSRRLPRACRDLPVRDYRAPQQAEPRSPRQTGRRTRNSRRRGRRLVRHLQPHPRRESGASARARPGGIPDRLSRMRSGAGAGFP